MTEVNIGGVYTLIDLAKMLDPSGGRLLFCAQTLARKNPIVREFPIAEANQLLTHIGNRDLSLPTVQKRAINDGVPKSTHKEIAVTAPMALFETMSQIDTEILKLAGANAEAVRQRKDAKFLEAMAQSVADEIFYGSLADDVLGFNGLATMFKSSTTYPNGDSTWYYNVQLAGGDGSDTTSIWVIEPGLEKVHLIYPKGTQAGIEINDLGKQLVTGVTASTQFTAFVTQFIWRCGLFVQDERCVQRIANIETASTATANTFNDDQLITALNRLPGMGEGRNGGRRTGYPIREETAMDESDGTAILVRVVRVETALEEREKALELARQLAGTQLKTALDSLNTRLEGMNEFRHQLEKQESTFLKRTDLDNELKAIKEIRLSENKAINSRIDRLERFFYVGLGVILTMQVVFHIFFER